jgi:hypothetical protein
MGAKKRGKPHMNENQAKRDIIRRQYEALQDRLKEWAKNAALYSEDDYRKLPEYQEALTFFQQFTHKDGVKYGAVVEYARKLHEWLEKTDKTLDEKADSIIKYLSGGSALVTVVALLSLKTDSTKTMIIGAVVLICLLPSLVTSVLAIYYAICVRIPQSSASPPQIPDAVTIAETYKDTEAIELNLWLILTPICEVAYVRNMNKAGYVKTAHRLYLGAIAGLILPLLGGAVCFIAFLFGRA